MKTVLVVDDEKAIRDMIVALLEEVGYQVATAQSGLEAIDCLSEVQPDLVLSDVMMPGMEGGHLAAIMHARPEYRAIPVVGMTALNELRRDYDANFAAVVHKPFEIAVLLETIESTLMR
ncbi:MAG: response regulator [Chloroflexota bacterium]|nr:response regulator [Chloroflexota bacterium]